jgi:hypothetical protein
MPERHTAAPVTTDQTVQRSLAAEAETEQAKKSLLDLSVTQVLGGALAAMTAAALGSRFSVAGTVVGAALASVIAAVASSLYTASLRRTGQTVRAVLGGRPADAAGPLSQSGQPQPVSEVAPAVAAPLVGTVDESAKASRRRALIVRAVLGALAMFALTAGALTIYEAASGHALSGGKGTTFSQVQHGGGQDKPTKEKAPTPSQSSDPSDTAEPSADPSAGAQQESSPTAAPSVEPSGQAPTEASTTPEPRASATAPSASTAPSQTPRPR